MTPDHIRDPAAILRASFAAIRRETDLSRLPAALVPVAERLVHACGMPDIVGDLAWEGDPAGVGREALASGGTVLVDAGMVAAGIARRALPAGANVLCTLDGPGVAERAAALGLTRSAAALDLWDDRLPGAVVAIGNAPTALFRLIERIAAGDAPAPACLLAFPVGFVGAAESKEALIAARLGVPFLTLRGRRGGSALAAAAVNALFVDAP